MSVWKDSRELGKEAGEVAAALVAKKKPANSAVFKDGSKHIPQQAILLAPVPITKANLKVVIDAKWIIEGRGLRRSRRGQGAGGLQVVRVPGPVESRPHGGGLRMQYAQPPSWLDHAVW